MAVRDAATYEVLGADPYTVVRVLGQGVGSTTQLVKVGENSPLYARKIISAEYANVEAWQALERVSHPLVPRVIDQRWRGGSYEVVYDYVPGESLADFIKRNGTLNERYAASILLDVADAAAALHASGIVHRDISPGNVIVDLKGRAHLSDLGIARVVENGQSHDTTLLGTWGFAAPEQYGFAQTDARSDVYSMGRLLAYACTGVKPGNAPGTLDDWRVGFDSLSSDIVSVINTACAFEPSARFQTAGAFATALSSCMGRLPQPTASGMHIVGEKGPLLLRALGWVALVTWAFLAFVFLIGSIGVFRPDVEAENPVGSFLLGVDGLVVSIICVIQTRHALKLNGRYAQRKGRVRKLLLFYLFALGSFLAIYIALIMVFTLLGFGASKPS